jgi:sugar lactone lactonase YvrE
MSDFGASQSVYRFDAVTGVLVDQFINDAPLADGQEWDSNGNIYVSSGNNVRRYDSNGVFIDNFVSGQLGLALDNLFLPDGSLLVSDFNQNVVRRFDANGVFLGNVISLAGPQGLEIGPDGNLYAGSFTNGIINRYDINTFQFPGLAANAASTTNNFTFGPPAPIPEPGLIPGLALGFAALASIRRRP